MKKYALPFLMLVILFTVFCLFGGLKQRNALMGAGVTNALQISTEGLDGMIQWKAPNSEEQACFVVERSENGKTYEALGHIRAGIPVEGSYAFRDANFQHLKASTIHYRVREVNQAGESRVMAQNSIDRRLDKPVSITSAEVPSNKLVIHYLASNPSPAHMHIVDQAGKIILYKQLPTARTEQELSIDVEDWKNGTYFIQLFDGSSLTGKHITIG